METTNSNKLALALLSTLLATMALGIFTNAIFAPNKAMKPGYALPVATEAAAPPPKAAPEEPLPALLAKADPTKGQADTKACQACHNFQKGAAAKVGPPLYGVVGRPVASIAGFNYSDTLKKMGGNWTYEELFNFIKSPTGMEPGTKMSFPGEPDAHKRADILAYLKTLSDNPVAFPQ
ncbi:MAG: c-type cytochrome [Roseiarcus sp.]